jgi:hypothetical protein
VGGQAGWAGRPISRCLVAADKCCLRMRMQCRELGYLDRKQVERMIAAGVPDVLMFSCFSCESLVYW